MIARSEGATNYSKSHRFFLQKKAVNSYKFNPEK